MKLKTLVLSTTMLASVAGASPAFAQADPKAGALEEVIVTARKREESLQHIPVAVSALSGEALTRQNIREPVDLARSIPSLSMPGNGAETGTGSFIILRGQSPSDVVPTLSQPVGIYEDSVNIPHPVGMNLAFFDLERVEVLKGPQGTLYGRNTTAGAINIVTRGADYKGVHGFLAGEAGNYQDWKISGAVNVPLVDDRLALRLAYQHWNRDGYGRSAITGQKLGGTRDDDLARLSLRFDPTERFGGSLKLEYGQAKRSDALMQMRVLVANPGLGFSPLGPLIGAPYYVADAEALLEGLPRSQFPSVLLAGNQGDLFTNYTQQRPFEKLKTWHMAFDWSWDITDSIRLRSITGYHRYQDFRTFDLDGIPIVGTEVGYAVGGFQPPAGFGVTTSPLRPDQETRQWTQEFNLSGDLGERAHWMLGAFASNDKGESQQTFGQTPALGLGSLGFPFLASYYAPDIRNESWALFTQNDIKITDRLSATLGARYTEEDLGLRVRGFISNLGPFGPRYLCLATNLPSATEAGCEASQSASFSGTSYLASLNFQLTPDTLLYARKARGFRGGALQLRAATFAPASPEIAEDYEVGLKSDLLDHRLRVNVAAFQTDYSNKQETAIIVINGVTASPLQNAATAKIRGVEWELTAAPAEGLILTTSGSYLDAKYGSFPAAVTPTGIVNASGSRLITNGGGGPPVWSFNFGARYERDAFNGKLGVAGDYSWKSKVPTTVLNNDPQIPRALQDEWRKPVGLVNLNIYYTMPGQGLTVSLFATNLTDEHYQRQGLSFATLGYTGTTQEPRMWGVSLRKTFGEE